MTTRVEPSAVCSSVFAGAFDFRRRLLILLRPLCAALAVVAAMLLGGAALAAAPVQDAALRDAPPGPVPPGAYGPHPGLNKGVFLVASRRLSDPNFSRSVVFLLDHDANGAMGVVINRPTGVELARLLPDVSELRGRDDAVYLGGPVGRGSIVLLIRADHRPDGAEPVRDDVYVSGSLAVLREMLDAGHAPGEAPGHAQDTFHAYAGYAGWAPGQLESEVARGDWHVARADAGIIFDAEPSQVWQDLIRRESGLWVRRGDASHPGAQAGGAPGVLAARGAHAAPGAARYPASGQFPSVSADSSSAREAERLSRTVVRGERAGAHGAAVPGSGVPARPYSGHPVRWHCIRRAWSPCNADAAVSDAAPHGALHARVAIHGEYGS